MRYSIVSKGLSLAQVETELKSVGATNITKTKLLGHVFCDLNAEQAKTLSGMSGLLVKPIKEYKTDQVETALPPVETFSDVFICYAPIFSHPSLEPGLPWPSWTAVSERHISHLRTR